MKEQEDNKRRDSLLKDYNILLNKTFNTPKSAHNMKLHEEIKKLNVELKLKEKYI